MAFGLYTTVGRAASFLAPWLFFTFIDLPSAPTVPGWAAWSWCWSWDWQGMNRRADTPFFAAATVSSATG